MQATQLRRAHELLFSLSLSSLVTVLVLRLTERAHPYSIWGHIFDWLQRELRLGRKYSTWFALFFLVLSVSVLVILQLIARTGWSVKALRLIPGFFAAAAPFFCWFPWGNTDLILLGLLLVPTIATGVGIYLYLQGRPPFGSGVCFGLLVSYFVIWGYVIAVQFRNQTLLVIPSIGLFSCLVWGQYVRSRGES